MENAPIDRAEALRLARKYIGREIADRRERRLCLDDGYGSEIMADARRVDEAIAAINPPPQPAAMQTSSMPAGLLEEHRSYNTFVKDIWVRPGDRPPSESVEDLGGFAVAALGLSGESVEVLDEVDKAARSGTVHAELIEELGDVRYYWFRLCQLTELDPVRCMDPATATAKPSQNLATDLVFACSRAAEAIKKHLRDGGHAAAKVETALRAVDANYTALLSSLAIDERLVLDTNRNKLTQRFAPPRRPARRA